MAGLSAKEHYPYSNVTILERNSSLGNKLKLTGGGRCNVTCDVDINDIILNTPKNGKFLYSSLNLFNSKHIIDFFNKNNFILKKEENNKMFPKSNKSLDIVTTLYNSLIRLGVKIKFNTLIKDINNNKKELYTESNEIIKYDYLIISTGGKSYTKTGSDGTGFNLAKKIGHTITDLYPSAVSLVSNDKVIQDKVLQGISIKNALIKVFNNNGKKIEEIEGDIIFTHFGLSGPGILKASYYVSTILNNDFPYLEINFLNNDSELLPKRLVNYFLELYKDKYLDNLSSFKINIHDTKGLNNAFVTNGGIKINEINPKTMKSKIDNNISFCGEIIDICSHTGGYNITCAMSTGYSAGKYVKIW